MPLLNIALTPYRQWFILLGIAALAAACSDDDDAESVYRHEHVDEGTLCMSAGPEAAPVVNVKAWYGCLSSSCDQLVSTECNIEVDGARLIVHSRTVVDSQGRECTADCGMVAAECRSEVVPAGTYEVVYGDRTTTVTIPRDLGSVPFDNEPSMEAGCY